MLTDVVQNSTRGAIADLRSSTHLAKNKRRTKDQPNERSAYVIDWGFKIERETQDANARIYDRSIVLPLNLKKVHDSSKRK